MAETWEKVSGYDWVEYTDDAIFEIDHDNKTIQHLDGQTMVYGEAKSQYIRFNIGRYYDGIDLSDKNIRVVWKNTAKNADINAVVNVERSEDGLRFGWLIPKEACYCNGKLTFDIEFTNDDETYMLKTRTYDARIYGSLDGGSIIPEPVGKEWYITIQERCNTVLTKAETAAKTATEKATTAETAAQTATEKATQAETAKAEVDEKASAAISQIQTAGAEQIAKITEAGGGIENALSNYFALRRNGKVFTTKIYKYSVSTSSTGVKMNANENMVAEPSVGRTEGRDDYQQYGLFQHFTCNWSVDENGFNHVDALEGQTGFTKYGKVQVGEVTCGAWFGVEDTEDAVLYHYSDSQTELTPQPMKECVNPDGTISPWMIHAKYIAGDIDGAPYSSKGLAPASGCQAQNNPVSYNGMIAYMHKLGNHYCGTTCWDLFYRQLMMIIKYGTINSQSIMAGCTSYSQQYQNLVAETGVKRIVITKAQASGLVIGSYVSIGDIGSNTNKDRNLAYTHNKAFSVKILKIEDVDDTNAAVYVDATDAFDTTLTTYITTMLWRSGSTDEVAGSDGSPSSNTSGKELFKIQGIETAVGAYEVLGNVVMDIVTGSDGNPVRDVYVCEDASTLTSDITTIRTNYKKASAQVTYTAGNWKYITEETVDTSLGIMIPTGTGGGSSTGFADGLYTDTSASGQREWLALGILSAGSLAGLWFLFAYGGLSGAYWYIVSGVSPNGTRGEWQASA